MKVRFTFLIPILFLFACSDLDEQDLVGYWTLHSVKTNQQITNKDHYSAAMDQLIRTTAIQFNADHSFGGSIWGDTSFGYWSIKNDSLIVDDISNKLKFSVLIKELSSKKLILQEEADSVIEILTFAKQELK